MPKEVDYLKRKPFNKIKNHVCNVVVSRMLKKYEREHQIQILGLENLDVKSGAVITTNHFNYFDSAPFICAMKKLKHKHKFHILIREGNYQITGKLGFLIKNYNTFPLSSNMRTTMILNRTIDKVLRKNHFLLVYPEQAMWWNYRKPRLYKLGAYRWASRNNVPIIPCFCTMEDMDGFEEDGLQKQKLTYHIMSPIYPKSSLSEKENAEFMREENLKMCLNLYESVYGKNQ